MAYFTNVYISLIPGLRYSQRIALEQQLDGEVSPFTLAGVLRSVRGKRASEVNADQLHRRSEQITVWMHRHGVNCITASEKKYPELLRHLYDPPYLLYMLGGTFPTDTPAFAIVGTRNPSPCGVEAAYRLGREAGMTGITTVSGLAIGIDQAAHTGTISSRGATWAVLGSGFDCIYPASTRSLVSRILEEQGGLISEYNPFSPPMRWHFPQRNRIISGLCRATCVVEAPLRSGALITAEFALEQGRDVYVHACSTEPGRQSEQTAGTKRLAEEGAPVLSSMKEVCLDWGIACHALPDT